MAQRMDLQFDTAFLYPADMRESLVDYYGRTSGGDLKAGLKRLLEDRHLCPNGVVVEFVCLRPAMGIDTLRPPCRRVQELGRFPDALFSLVQAEIFLLFGYDVVECLELMVKPIELRYTRGRRYHRSQADRGDQA